MKFKIKIEPEAREDIQQGIDWYNEQKKGLGRKFHQMVKEHIAKLKTYPFYQVRYSQISCLPLKKYPYMFYFTVGEDEQLVTIRAVFHTSLDPDKWTERSYKPPHQITGREVLYFGTRSIRARGGD